MADSQFSRPELRAAYSYHRSDLLTRFQEDVLLRRMDAEVYARCAGRCSSYSLGYIDYLARNMLPDLCDEDWLYTGTQNKALPPKGRSGRGGLCTLGWNQRNADASAGTQIQRDDQVTFTTTQTVKASGGVLRVPLVADNPGAAGTPMTALPYAGHACKWHPVNGVRRHCDRRR